MVCHLAIIRLISRHDYRMMTPMNNSLFPTFSARFAQLGKDFSLPVSADPLPQPRLVDACPVLAASFGLNVQHQPHQSWLTAVTAGAQLAEGMQPVAALYAGHQFGHFVPQLGDGRALLLGNSQSGQGYWEWQLKGAGVTPFSRRGDGRAVLRSSIREYLVSHAMQGLGIPTTQALSIVASDLPVYREQVETAACVLRLSPSFIRFGNFEVFYYRGQSHLLRELADYVLTHDYPECLSEKQPYQALLAQVIKRTAQLIAQWQSVGFMHGVMNTDNMSILGLTLDYGPFMFMETYQPDFVCNHSDDAGRYAFNRQPEIGLFNCACLAQAMLPLLDAHSDTAVAVAKDLLDAYWLHYHSHYLHLMRAKLGLQQARDEDALLIRSWLNVLHQEQLDFTLAHRQLSSQTICPFKQESSIEWWAWYQQRLQQENTDEHQRRNLMDSVNPLYVLRTWMAQVAIDQAQRGDDSGVQQLRKLLARPFTAQEGMEAYAQPAPAWAQGLSLSCSS